ncbi:DMT family transporter [Clostridium sp. DL1XJH146]
MKSSIKIILAMIIWGSLGLFVKNINLPAMEIAFFRALIASFFYIIIGLFSRFTHLKSRTNSFDVISNGTGFLDIKLPNSQNFGFINKESNNKDLLLLILSGVAMGFNWVLLFQAYKMTSIANATLSYYFAPVLVILVAPLILKEPFNLFKLVSVLISMYGLFIIITGNFDIREFNAINDKGIVFGLAAAVFYCSVIILNNLVKSFSNITRTKIQLFSSLIVLIPFIIYRNNLHSIDTTSVIYILIIGVVHTGIAYYLYFSGIKEASAGTAAILSYIDPISALILSFLILGELLTIYELVGALLILGATFVVQNFSLSTENGI